MEEVSLLLDAVARLDEPFLLVIVVIVLKLSKLWLHGLFIGISSKFLLLLINLVIVLKIKQYVNLYFLKLC